MDQICLLNNNSEALCVLRDIRWNADGKDFFPFVVEGTQSHTMLTAKYFSVLLIAQGRGKQWQVLPG